MKWNGYIASVDIQQSTKFKMKYTFWTFLWTLLKKGWVKEKKKIDMKEGANYTETPATQKPW